MIAFNTAKTTSKGNELVSNILAGSDTVTFTKMVLSSHDYSSTDLSTLTDLEDIEQTVTDLNVEIGTSNTVKVTALFSNYTDKDNYLKTDYTIRTCGLYAKNAAGTEILMRVATASNSDTMPAYDGGIDYSISTEIYSAVGDTDKVVIDVDPAGTATKKDLSNHVNSNVTDGYVHGAFFDTTDEMWKIKKSDGTIVEAGGTGAKVIVTAEASTEITATCGTRTITKTSDTNGFATFSIPEYGDWTFTVVYPKTTRTKTISITSAQLYTLKLKSYYLVGFRRNTSESNPDKEIEYIEDNADFTPAHMDFTNGAFDYGSWDVNEFPLNLFRPVALKYDGTVDYELNHNDQTKKLDGTASDISNTSYAGNFMVECKTIYVKRTQVDDNTEEVRFSDVAIDDTYKAYAHTADDGSTILEAIYLPMFEGSSVSSKVRSIAGQTPMNTQSGATEQTQIEANGSGWFFDDDADHRLIEDLCYLISRTTQSQTAFGNGHYTGGSQPSSLLTTGTLKDKGMFYGTNGNDAVKIFWLENYYGDRWDRTAGRVYGTDGHIKVKPHRPYNTDGTGYIDTGITISGTSGGCISKTKLTEYGRMPVEVSGSETTYIPDGCWFNTSQLNYLLSGGACDDGLRVGVSCVGLNNLFSDASWDFGPSLSYKKPMAA